MEGLVRVRIRPRALGSGQAGRCGRGRRGGFARLRHWVRVYLSSRRSAETNKAARERRPYIDLVVASSVAQLLRVRLASSVLLQ